jgi:hypothetical protein
MPVQQSSLIYKIKRATEIYLRYYAQRDLPVLVYCTGRVGSIAMYDALAGKDVFVFKIENLNPNNGQRNRGSAKWVYEHIAKPRRPAKVIFIVRNPVALMVSDFLPKLNWITGDEHAYKTLTTEALCATFNEKYFAQGRHTEKLNWFDEQAKRFLGIDVYSHPFDINDGYTHFETDLYNVLIVRTEMNDAEKSRVVGEFVGVPDLQISRTNIGEQNRYGEAYKAFKANLVIDETHLQTIFQSNYSQHFYGDAMLNKMNVQWIQ